MSSEEVPLLLHLCSGADARLDVLFVHGLTGTPKETWTNADGAFWPKWLCADLPGVSVYTLGYPASMFGKWAKKEMDLHERAASMLEHLAAHGIGKRPIALVCHSLGGILAKEMLRTSAECNDSSWQQIAEKHASLLFLEHLIPAPRLLLLLSLRCLPGFSIHGLPCSTT
jgi:alpha-beta hydrolase superfamily lysophospholipase